MCGRSMRTRATMRRRSSFLELSVWLSHSPKIVLTIFQYLRWMRTRVHVSYVFQNQRAIGIEQHGHPRGKPIRRTVRSAVIERQGFVVVGPNLIFVVFVLGPLLIFAGLIPPHAHYLNAECIEITLEVAVPATLDRSAIGARSG